MDSEGVGAGILGGEHAFLYVPRLSYNLLSVSKATDTGKTTEFDNVHCRIIGKGGKLLAMGTKVGSLYYLDYQKITRGQQVNAAETKKPGSKQSIWHRRFGHLGVRNLQKLAQDNMINGFDFDTSSDLTVHSVRRALVVNTTRAGFQKVRATVLLSH